MTLVDWLTRLLASLHPWAEPCDSGGRDHDPLLLDRTPRSQRGSWDAFG